MVQQATVRPRRYPETLAKVAGARFFTNLHANSGIWQVKLDSATKLTTFITRFGKFSLVLRTKRSARAL